MWRWNGGDGADEHRGGAAAGRVAATERRRGARLELNGPLRAGSSLRLVIQTTEGIVDETVTVLWSHWTPSDLAA